MSYELNQLGLRDVLATGGEGTLYAIPRRPTHTAKVYHPSSRTEHRARKIEFMTRKKVTGTLSKMVAWPEDAILECGKIIGFTMTRFDAKPLESLLSNDECFKVDWKIRVKIVLRLSTIVAGLHAAGIVVGDLHPSNFGFTSDGNVVMFDLDSVQVRDGARLYPCIVAHDDSRPPELAGVDLSATAGALNMKTDDYMLASAIFRILIGCHPYAGVRISSMASSCSGSLSKAVLNGDFVFETNPNAAPKYAALYETVGELRPLFRRAFVEGSKDPGMRPTAIEFVRAITSLSEEKVSRCSVHGSYPFRLGKCPFCSVQQISTLVPSVKRSASKSLVQPSQVPANGSSGTEAASIVLKIVGILGLIGLAVAAVIFIIAILSHILGALLAIAILVGLFSAAN